MSDYKDKDKKGGFLSALGGLFRSGASVGGASSGMGSAGMGAGGLGGLFATKAGILGMVLGGATIAAGVGVVYNFIGPASKPVYSPDLFQNSYYEEEASKAEQARSMSRDSSGAASSTLDIFREQARKDGLSGLAGEAGGDSSASSESPSAADAAGGGVADASAEAPAVDGASAAGGSGAGRLQPKSFSSGGAGAGGGGGSATSIPRMQAAGGLSGGIGAQFKSMYKAPAQSDAGKLSGMSASAARLKNSPKYSVPNVNKKGAFGQAKFAGKMGRQAAKMSDYTQSATGATEAFSGETVGSNDVVTPETGAGLGGAGVSDGGGLKSSDPSLNSNESTPPECPDPVDVDPWQQYEDMAMNSIMWAGGLILVTMGLSKLGRHMATTVWGLPYAAIAFKLAMATAAAAIVFALKVLFAGIMMMTKYDQKMMGGIYVLTGVMLAYQAIQALMEAQESSSRAGEAAESGKPMTKADWKTFDNGGWTAKTKS